MTVAIEDTKEVFAGNGAATEFAFDFKVNSASDVLVQRMASNGATETLLVNTDYTITLHANQNTSPGGTIKIPPTVGEPLPTGERLVVMRNAAFTQPTAFTLGVLPSTLESKLDNLTMFVQQLLERAKRAFSTGAADPTFPTMDLGTVAQRAGKYVKFDSSGNAELADITASALTQSSFDAFLSNVSDAVKTGFFALSDAAKASFFSTIAYGAGTVAQAFYAVTKPISAAELAAGFTSSQLSKQYDYGHVLRYGIDTTGVIDATIPLTSLLNMGGRIWCGENTTIRMGGALLMDISKSSLEGRGVIFDMSAGGTLQVYSSHVFDTGGPPPNWTHKISGIRFRGNLGVGHTGITVGRVGGAYGFSSEILFEKCSFFKFDTAVAFTDNAWRTRFDHCGFEYMRDGGRMLSFPAGINNAGEVMQFDHCWFVIGSAPLYLDTGHWLFNGCSFGVAVTIRGVTDARININGCNIEAQAHTGYRMIHLSGASNCTVDGGQLVINAGLTFGMAPILLDSADSSISINGLHVPLSGTHLRFENDATYGLRHIAVGVGRVTARGCASYSLSTLNGPSNNVQLAKMANLLTNGAAEYGTTSGWTPTSSGGGTGTNVSSASAAYLGTRGFRMTAPNATDNIVITQDVPCGLVSSLAALYFVTRAVSGTGTVASMSLRFLDKDGAPITASDRSDTIASTDTTFTHKCIVGIVPPGAYSVRAQFTVNAVGGGNIADFDEICLNVI